MPRRRLAETLGMYRIFTSQNQLTLVNTYYLPSCPVIMRLFASMQPFLIRRGLTLGYKPHPNIKAWVICF